MLEVKLAERKKLCPSDYNKGGFSGGGCFFDWGFFVFVALAMVLWLKIRLKIAKCYLKICGIYDKLSLFKNTLIYNIMST